VLSSLTLPPSFLYGLINSFAIDLRVSWVTFDASLTGFAFGYAVAGCSRHVTAQSKTHLGLDGSRDATQQWPSPSAFRHLLRERKNIGANEVLHHDGRLCRKTAAA
jgi:hypothetical protein